jgi:hypothetical protein
MSEDFKGTLPATQRKKGDGEREIHMASTLHSLEGEAISMYAPLSGRGVGVGGESSFKALIDQYVIKIHIIQ